MWGKAPAERACFNACCAYHDLYNEVNRKREENKSALSVLVFLALNGLIFMG